ncbi:MAG: hypothetical protein OXI38_14350, partial [Bacteroidota bacterium]|nr:hypothetical protein [Bacteroidota bacterium]
MPGFGAIRLKICPGKAVLMLGLTAFCLAAVALGQKVPRIVVAPPTLTLPAFAEGNSWFILEGTSVTVNVKPDPNDQNTQDLRSNGGFRLLLPGTSDLGISYKLSQAVIDQSNWTEGVDIMINIGADPDNTGGCQGLLIEMEPVNLTAGFSGSTYPFPGSVGTNICVIDDEAGIVAFPTEIDVDEGETATVSVRLLSSPGASGVSVDIIEALLPAGGSVTPKIMTFDDTDWGVGQTVKLDAGIDDNTVSEAGLLGFAVTRTSHPWYGQRLYVPVMVNDDDVDGIDVPVAMTDGGMKAFDMVSTAQPVANVEVGSSGRSGTDLMPSPMSLTFGNQRIPQPVSAAADTDFDDESGMLPLAAKGKKAIGQLVVSQTEFTVYEGSCNEPGPRRGRRGTASFTIGLTEAPTYEWGWTFIGWWGFKYMGVYQRYHSPDFRWIPEGRTVDPILFTQPGLAIGYYLGDDWNDETEVWICGEAIPSDGKPRKIELVPYFGNYRYSSRVELTVNVVAAPLQKIVLSESTMSIDEGSSGTYTVKLETQPTAEVTVAITGQSGTDLTVMPTSLTFTTADFSTVQTVTVSAGEDTDATDDRVTLVHTASGGDYEGQTASIAVTVDDDDVGILLSPVALGVNEGRSNTYTVKLATQPTAQVTVAITGQSGTDLTLDKTSLTFNPSGSDLWSTAQRITVSAGPDDDGANDGATLVHMASGGDYAGQIANLPVTTIDDETSEIVLSPTSLEVNEGSNDTYTVKLATQPTAEVTVAITGQSGTDLTVMPTSLTFTTANWGTVQTVTVAAGEDEDGADDSAKLAHTASGGDYAGKTDTLMVNTTDNDTPGIVLSPTSLGVTEGGNDTYTVKLATQPTAEVRVRIGGRSGTDVTLDKNRLTFNPIGSDLWSTAQTVTVTAGTDNDAVNDLVTLVHRAVGGDYEGETERLAVTVYDVDKAIVVNPMDLPVDEGSDA